MLNKKDTVLITGATSGIGRATALLLAKEGYQLIITGRRTDRLKELSDIIEQTYQGMVFPLAFDIRNKQAIEKAIDQLPENWKNIRFLINNAGLASGFDFFDDGNTDDWDLMIDTNLKGLLYITKKVIPLLLNTGNGHIVNLGSIAGKETYTKGSVYCSTKHAVESLTKGMRIDLLRHNIKVSSVCPGAVETEFSMVRFKGNKEKADAVYDGFDPLIAEDIADAIHYVISRPPHVTINDILIMPTAQATGTIFNRKKS